MSCPPSRDPIAYTSSLPYAVGPGRPHGVCRQVAATLTAEMRRRTLLQRLWHAVRSGRTPLPAGRAPTASELAEHDLSNAVVYSALVSDGRLHRSLARAFFSYHDRLATRRRRAVNAVKGTFTFVCFNILDFVLTNL